MKKLLFYSLASLFFFSSCGSKNEKTAESVAVKDSTIQIFGDTISEEGAVPTEKLMEQLSGKDSVQIKLVGRIEEVCQKKGCWMNMKIGDNQSMRVSFKDYAFFVPKDAAGRKVFIEGFAYLDTISVAERKHFAEDAGETKEEIEKIIEPEISISFEANGVIIKE